MKRHFWLNLFLALAGIVAGALAAELTAGISWLSWLSFGLEFGTAAPFTLDLNVMRLTFGINVRITVSTILFVALALLLGRLLKKD